MVQVGPISFEQSHPQKLTKLYVTWLLLTSQVPALPLLCQGNLCLLGSLSGASSSHMVLESLTERTKRQLVSTALSPELCPWQRIYARSVGRVVHTGLWTSPFSLLPGIYDRTSLYLCLDTCSLQVREVQQYGSLSGMYCSFSLDKLTNQWSLRT